MTLNPDGSIIDADFDKPGWSEQTGWVGPSWVGDGGATLVSGPIQVGNEDVVQHTPGDESNGIPDAISRWFSDPSAKGMADGETTRNKEKLADVTGPEHEELWLYRAKGGHRSIAGATNPDRGPADVPPARPAPAPGPLPAPAPKPGGPGTKPTPTKNTTTTPNGAAITLTTKVCLRTALKKGLTVRLSGVQAGTVKAVALHAGRTVASGRAQVGRTGKASVKLVFTKKARRSLAKRTTVKPTPKAGEARGTVTLKR